MEKFDFKTIGTNYTILDKDTNDTSSIRVIDANELYAAIGTYTQDNYTYINAHLGELLKGFRGFANCPWEISWYSAPESTYALSNAIIQARREGNDIVVMEVLPNKELDITNRIS
jgi:hypothetical protein